MIHYNISFNKECTKIVKYTIRNADSEVIGEHVLTDEEVVTLEIPKSRKVTIDDIDTFYSIANTNLVKQFKRDIQIKRLV